MECRRDAETRAATEAVRKKVPAVSVVEKCDSRTGRNSTAISRAAQRPTAREPSCRPSPYTTGIVKVPMSAEITRPVRCINDGS